MAQKPVLAAWRAGWVCILQAWVVPAPPPINWAHTGRLKGQRCPHISSSLQPKPQETRLFTLSPFQLLSLVQVWNFISNLQLHFSETLKEIKHLEMVNSNAATKWGKHCFLLKKGCVHPHREEQWEVQLSIICYIRKIQVGPFQPLSRAVYLGDCKVGASIVSGWNQHTGCSQLIIHWEPEQAVHLPSWHNSSSRRANSSQNSPVPSAGELHVLCKHKAFTENQPSTPKPTLLPHSSRNWGTESVICPMLQNKSMPAQGIKTD